MRGRHRLLSSHSLDCPGSACGVSESASETEITIMPGVRCSEGLRGEVGSTEEGQPVLWAYLPSGLAASECALATAGGVGNARKRERNGRVCLCVSLLLADLVRFSPGLPCRPEPFCMPRATPQRMITGSSSRTKPAPRASRSSLSAVARSLPRRFWTRVRVQCNAWWITAMRLPFCPRCPADPTA